MNKLNNNMENERERPVSNGMKILIATGIYPPQIGGPATYTKLMEEFLPKCGAEVNVESFGWVLHLPKIIRHFVYFFRLLKKGRQVDIIFAQDPVSVGLPALVASFLLRKRFFIRVAGDYAWEQASQRYGVRDSIDDFQKKKYSFRVEFLRKVQRFVVSHAEGVVTPSEYFKILVAGWVREKEKVHCIYNGIKTPENLLSREVARQTLKLSKDAKIILSAGRLVPWKGFDVLIEVLDNLVKESSFWSFIIIGDGPDRSRLEGIVKEKSLEKQVLFVGALSREVLFQYMSAGDALVLNTSFESFSFQVVEAMAVGLPVVVADSGNLREIIEDKKEGLFISLNDWVKIVDAIRLLDNDSQLRTHIIQNAKKKSEKFSAQNTAETLVKLFSQK